jgi:predicted PurR-regulated permease PerM
VSWFTDPDAVHKYPRRTLAFVAPSCGVIVGVISYWDTHNIVVSVVFGLVATALMAQRVRRFSRKGMRVPGRLALRLVPALLLTLGVLAFGVADGSLPEVAFGAAGTAFWCWIYWRAKTQLVRRQ